MTDPRPKNANGKPFSWSYSAINDFDTCPYQYAAKRFYESVKFEHTEATLWGDRVHKAKENRLKHGTPLPADFPKEWERYCEVFEKRATQGMKLVVEDEIAFDMDGNLTSWFSKQAWARNKVDVLLLRDDTAYIYDWKTGKVRESLLQLQLSVWFIGQKYPHIQNFVSKFIWLNSLTVTGQDFTRAEHMQGIEDMLHEKLKRMTTAWRTKVFQPKESGLCRGWCPVEECRFWKEKR